MVHLTNSTCTFSLNRPLNFKNLKRRFGSAVQRSSKPFKRLMWKLDQFGCTALIYESGNVVLVGARRAANNFRASFYLFKHLRGISPLRPVIRNFAATHNFAQNLNLYKFYYYLREMPENAIRSFGYFEPETFPALTYRTHQSSMCKATIFRSGHVILSGCKKIADVASAYDEIANAIANFTL